MLPMIIFPTGVRCRRPMTTTSSAGSVTTRRISTAATDHEVVVAIADSGPGVPDDVLPHVFEPFFTTKDVGRGTGLGLDISRRIIVDRHGGDISVTRSGDETVFRVSLPLPRPA